MLIRENIPTMNLLIRKIQTALNFLILGEVYLFVRAIFINIFPPSMIGMGKFYCYSCSTDISIQMDNPDLSLLIGSGDIKDFPCVARCFGTESSERVIACFHEFLKYGGELWIARDGKVDPKIVAGVIWVYRNKYIIPFEGYGNYCIRLNIGINNAYIATVHVNTGYRRQGVFSKMMYHLRCSCRDTSFFSTVDAINTVSILAHEKNGFHIIGRIYFLRIISKTFCFLSIPGCNHFFLKLSKGRVRDIEVKI